MNAHVSVDKKWETPREEVRSGRTQGVQRRRLKDEEVRNKQTPEIKLACNCTFQTDTKKG